MNETINTILNHVSVRSFTDQKLSKEQVELLIQVAQMASSASFQQAYSIIEVKDEEIRKAFVEPCGGQLWTTQGNYFLFVGDFYRHKLMADEINVDIEDSLISIDTIMKGTIDATLAAQNMIIAAESMGLGVCVIGGARDGIETVSKLLELPEYVYPIFGLVIGYPAQRNDIKPRLPMKAIYHVNKYNKDQKENLKEYDKITKEYYAKRKGKKQDRIWSTSTVEGFKKYPRTYIKDYLQSKKLAKQ